MAGDMGRWDDINEYTFLAKHDL